MKSIVPTTKNYYMEAAEPINRLFREVLAIPYRFFEQSSAKELGLHYISIDDFSVSRTRDDYPSATDGNGYTESCYQWEKEGLSFQLFFAESWTYGAWPADTRYDLPSKITLEDQYTLHICQSAVFDIRITIDKLKKIAELEVTGQEAATILAFLEAGL